MEGIGSYLKRERELRGISLDDIAKVTKINIKILKALEADNLSSLPPPVFVKGFIRSYSHYIGIDATDAILRYEDIERQKELDKEVSKGEKGSRLKIPSPLLIIAGFFLISIFFLIILKYK